MDYLSIELFGNGPNLTTAQVCTRAFLMFFIALALVRLGGARIFGKKSALDDVVTIMLGAVLAKGITGASQFTTVIIAGTLLVLVHRLIAILCVSNRRIDLLAKEKQVLLYSKGKLYMKNLLKCSLSKNDLMESLRLECHTESLEEIESAYMENSGIISFIRKKP